MKLLGHFHGASKHSDCKVSARRLLFRMKGDTRSLLCVQTVIPGAGCAAARKHRSLLSATDVSGICRGDEIRVYLSPTLNINTDLSQQLHRYRPRLEESACIFVKHNPHCWSFFSVTAFLPLLSSVWSILVSKKGIWRETFLIFITLTQLIRYKKNHNAIPGDTYAKQTNKLKGRRQVLASAWLPRSYFL